jgi:hypothetical protein
LDDPRGAATASAPRPAGERRIAPRALGGLPLSLVPDKRQTSKQRRAARNRASRDALAARRTNAVTGATVPSTSRASSAGPAGAGSGTAATAAGRTGFGGLLGAGGRRRPGDLAVLVALVLAIGAAVVVLFQRVDVDDRGEPLPAAFKGVAVLAIEASGRGVPDSSASLIDAYGAGILLPVALPVAVAAFAFWANRRPNRSRALTYTMVAMAVAILFSAGIGTFFLPSLIALGFATYQVRKADMPARVAEKAAPTRGRGRVIDAESEELGDESTGGDGDRNADELAGGTASRGDEVGDDGGDETGRETGDEADPLAELEAEMEAEERSRRGGDPPRGSTPEE